MLNTVLGNDFKKIVNEKINERVKYVIAQKRMMVKALSEFVTIFKNSKNILVHKGRTNQLLEKYGKRKWDKIESDNRDKLKEAEKQLRDKEDKIGMLEFKVRDFYIHRIYYYRTSRSFANYMKRDISIQMER